MGLSGASTSSREMHRPISLPSVSEASPTRLDLSSTRAPSMVLTLRSGPTPALNFGSNFCSYPTFRSHPDSEALSETPTAQ